MRPPGIRRGGFFCEEFMTPEKELWCAVIKQAIDDAFVQGAVGGSNPEPEDVDEARQWLTAPASSVLFGADFELVCQSAGIDPDALRDRAREWARGGWMRPGVEQAA